RSVDGCPLLFGHPFGQTLVDFGRDDPFVGDDLTVLTVETDLESVVGDHYVPPLAADAQVDLDDSHLAAVGVPPALDQLGRGPRFVDQVLGRVELPRDEDLLIRGERQQRRPTTRHCHLLPPPFACGPPARRPAGRTDPTTSARSSSPSRGSA